MTTQAVQTSPMFQARWEPALAPKPATTQDKIKEFAWNFFSIVLPFIGLSRWIGHKLNQKITPQVLLPSSQFPSEYVARAKDTFHSFWDTGTGKSLLIGFEPCRVQTPDGAELAAIFMRHKNATADTPTIVCFNPNAAIVYQSPFTSLFFETLNRGEICNFVVFDYRNSGDSKGTLHSFRDLVVDGASIVQWVREEIKTPDDKIHFYGWSLGGAVATEVKALDPEKTPGDLANERSFSSTDDMIEVISERAGVVGSKCLAGPMKALMHSLGQSFDIIPSLKRLKGRILVIFHRKDPIIPFPASVQHRAQDIPHESLELSLESSSPYTNHHAMPLDIYTDAATGKPAMERIGDFFFKKE